ncbi:hypothetical protein J8F10_31710 [Gemmata sp. G18]|uniref:Uncharacterized protein n=1 Tax=Gemmata palustris TaxID=2822762 RepID=A0ABS5C1P1_9BACT|nr:hypothetical protein [Gemmata palustris]MBP3959838.1 hypothetical protein [Gemmata palustris]
MIETAERFADGEAKKSELARADRAAAEVAVALKLPREPKGLIAKGSTRRNWPWRWRSGRAMRAFKMLWR